MNRKLAVAVFALPIGLSASLAKPASAGGTYQLDPAESNVVVQRYDDRWNVDPRYDNQRVRNQRYDDQRDRERREALRREELRQERERELRLEQNRRDDFRRNDRRVWIPGHYEPGFLGIGRRWVEGHWEDR